MTDPRTPSLPGTILGGVQDMVRSGAGYLADLVARIVHGIQAIALAPLVAMGCQSPNVDAARSAPAAESAPVTAPVDAGEGPRELGLFSITFYYVIGEDEVVRKPAFRKPVASNDNAAATTDQAEPAGDPELAAVAPPPALVAVYDKSCEPIVEVSREFAQQLRLQGTGKLRDGRVLNVSGHCNCPSSPCFKEVKQQWGTAGNGRPLQPFRTVAVDPRLIKLGSLLYVPLLEGRTMPGRAPWGGFVHDGCVVADDVGGGIKNRQLDLFVGRKGWFRGMARSGRPGSHAWAKNVPVFDGSRLCERKGRRVARKSAAI